MLNPIYSPASDRYENGMRYRRSGRSGVLLPEVSLGLWHNFGDVNPLSHSLAMAHYAFDHGITHFDLANNYGPSYGSAEETFGFIMKKSFKPYRDELFVSTKAGYDMWPGPYGNWGSRKSLRASCVWGWIMWTCSIPIVTTQRHRWRKRCRRWWTSCDKEKHYTWGFPNIRPARPKRLTVIWKRATCIACCIKGVTTCSTALRKRRAFWDRPGRTGLGLLLFHRWHKVCSRPAICKACPKIRAWHKGVS